MIGFTLRLLKYLAAMADNDCVGRNDQGWITQLLFGAQCRSVDIQRFLARCLKDVFEGGQSLRKVLRDGGGDDLNVGKAYLLDNRIK